MGYIDDKVELFDGRVITETLRQWIVLLVSVFIIGLITVSIVVLIRNSRKVFSSDVIMLLLIQTRIVLIVVFEFLFPDRFIVFLGELFYLVLLTIIFLMFVRNLSSEQHNLSIYYKIYFIVALAFIIGILVLGIIRYDNTFP